MSIPISNGEICQFVLEKQFMDYFTVQEYLTELVTSKYLDVTNDVENNVTRYTITDDGSEVISLFFNSIPEFARTEIVQYVHENERRIKQEYEVTANYFPQLSNEFSVKCGVYDEEGTSLMEITTLVPTKEQARLICSNWKKNVNALYGTILNTLVNTSVNTSISVSEDNDN